MIDPKIIENNQNLLKGVMIPENTLYSVLETILEIVRTDYLEAVNKDDSFLAYMFKGKVFDGTDQYEQAISLFTRDNNNPRNLEVKMFFTRERAHLPTIHITLPAESDATAPNGIGMDAGFADQIINNQGIATSVVSRSFATEFHILVTSDNVNEVLIIYHTLKLMLLHLHGPINELGFQKPEFGGNDLQLNQEMVSPRIAMRAIKFTSFYTQSIPSTMKSRFINDICVSYKMRIDG